MAVNSEMVGVANLRLLDFVQTMKLRKLFDISIELIFIHLELYARSVLLLVRSFIIFLLKYSLDLIFVLIFYVLVFYWVKLLH